MKQDVKEELQQIADSSADRRLHAEDVVKFAKNKTTALHKEMPWDDKKAAHEYRLNIARELIRVYVRFEPAVSRNVRAFVSLPSDRSERGGYRPVEEVLKRPDLVQQFVDEARAKIVAMKDHYSFIRDLDPLWGRLIAVVEDFTTESLRKAS